jgi:hypothetical protein
MREGNDSFAAELNRTKSGFILGFLTFAEDAGFLAFQTGEKRSWGCVYLGVEKHGSVLAWAHKI